MPELEDVSDGEFQYGSTMTALASRMDGKISERARLVVGEADLVISPKLGERFS